MRFKATPTATHHLSPSPTTIVASQLNRALRDSPRHLASDWRIVAGEACVGER